MTTQYGTVKPSEPDGRQQIVIVGTGMDGIDDRLRHDLTCSLADV